MLPSDNLHPNRKIVERKLHKSLSLSLLLFEQTPRLAVQT